MTGPHQIIGGYDQEDLRPVYIAPWKPTLRVVATQAPTDASRYHEQPKKHLQEGTTPLLPDPKMDLGFPPVFEQGSTGQGHDDASKKVTAASNVAVVSIT